MKYLIKYKTKKQITPKQFILCETQAEAEKFLKESRVKEVTRNTYRKLKNKYRDRFPANKRGEYSKYEPITTEKGVIGYRKPTNNHQSRSRKFTDGRKNSSEGGRLYDKLCRKGGIAGKGKLKTAL